MAAACAEELTRERSPTTVKQHLAALRILFDWLVAGQVLPFNPTSSVRGPQHVVKSAKETRALPDGIDVTNLAALRDRAFLAALVYSFARVAAAACVMGLPAGRLRLTAASRPGATAAHGLKASPWSAFLHDCSRYPRTPDDSVGPGQTLGQRQDFAPYRNGPLDPAMRSFA